MQEYFVQTGSLKMTIVAESPRAAAVAALDCWSAVPRSVPLAADSSHRAHLPEEIVVSKGRARRPARRFPTFNLLATLRGESPRQAWRRLLAQAVSNPN